MGVAFRHGLLGHGESAAFIWQALIGIGIFGSYAFGAGNFVDRVVAVSGTRGTCAVLLLCSDMAGHTATVALLLWKTFAAGDTDSEVEVVLGQFVKAVYILSVMML